MDLLKKEIAIKCLPGTRVKALYRNCVADDWREGKVLSVETLWLCSGGVVTRYHVALDETTPKGRIRIIIVTDNDIQVPETAPATP